MLLIILLWQKAWLNAATKTNVCLKTQLSFASSALKGIALRFLDQSIRINVQMMESAGEVL